MDSFRKPNKTLDRFFTPSKRNLNQGDRMTANNKRQQTLDRLYLQLDIQARSIRMTRAQREEANKIMKKIHNGHKMSDKV